MFCGCRLGAAAIPSGKQINRNSKTVYKCRGFESRLDKCRKVTVLHHEICFRAKIECNSKPLI